MRLISLEVKVGKIYFDGRTWRSTDFAVERSGLGSTAKAAEIKDVSLVEENFASGKSNFLLHKRPEDKAEMERYLADALLYVGSTRAKHLLYVVNAGQDKMISSFSSVFLTLKKRFIFPALKLLSF